MKKESKRILGLFLFGIIMISLFAGLVAAESLIDRFGGGDFDFWAMFEGVNAAKFLLFWLVVLIVFEVSQFVPFIKKKSFVSFLISVVIGMLSIFYLKNEEIYSVLLSYSAFGIALTGILPLILIAVISKKLGEEGYTMPAKFLWIVFIVVIIVRWLTGEDIGTFGQIAYPVILLIALGMFLWEKKLNWWSFKIKAREWADKDRAEWISDVKAKIDGIAENITNSKNEEVTNNEIKKYNKEVKKLQNLGIDYRPLG